jgi:hypothetical protein
MDAAAVAPAQDFEAPPTEDRLRGVTQKRGRGPVPQDDALTPVDGERSVGRVGEDPGRLFHGALRDSRVKQTASARPVITDRGRVSKRLALPV